MHGDRLDYVPSEAYEQDPKIEDVESVEEPKDNVIEFESHDGPAEHVVKHIFDKLSPHQKSLEILKEEGYSSIEQANRGLEELEAEEDKIKMSFGAKIKDRLFNQGQESKKLIAIEKKISLLNRKLRIAKITLSKEQQDSELVPNKISDNVVHVPESIWPGPDKEQETSPDNTDEEAKKAA